MSLREKMAWVSLATTLLVWGWYFIDVAAEVAGGNPQGGRILGMFVGAVVLSIVIEVVVAIVLAVVSPKEANSPADERERLIALKATRAAYVVLSLGVVVVALNSPIAAAADLGLFDGRPEADIAFIAANGIIFALVLAELIKSAGSIFLYRRGV